MNDCKSCVHYRLIVREGGCWETCGDNGQSTSFARADIGVWGWPHCGPEGKLWRERG